MIFYFRKSLEFLLHLVYTLDIRVWSYVSNSPQTIDPDLWWGIPGMMMIECLDLFEIMSFEFFLDFTIF